MTTLPPKVTIITPTYQRAVLLRATMESVFRCNYPNLQYIIIDDASSDDTQQVIQSFIERYPDVVTCFRNERNLGESDSINRGWQAAEGKYISTLSDDDLLLPDWFNLSVPFMEERPDVLVGYPDWHIIDSNGEVISTMLMQPYDFLRMFAMCYNFPGPGTIIRRSLLNDLKALRSASYCYAPDYAMWLMLATKGLFAHIPQPTACWRRHAASWTVTADSVKKAREMARMIDNFLHEFSDVPIVRQHARKIKVRAILHATYVLLRDGAYAEAMKYMFYSFYTSAYWTCMLVGCYIQRIIFNRWLTRFRKRTVTT